ncbi:coiled-coil domain-containing protein 115 [Boleophthalmus pectinirostris]|uniref:coiled-coil domain-containing protein 115 n=1 Tax=Boleophthalmus pectinirostris TaxID=150288 RepID=UPI00242A702C|nr:coiled-coil domain-containing protein 115 [Boleophthalmus pectinirostris]
MDLPDLELSSRELDEKLFHFMSQLELLEEKRASLNALIEQGWFSISKARYSMGNKQVSSLQYASEIEPRIFIHTQPLDNGEVKFSTNKVSQRSNDDLKPVEDVGPQETGVRRRNKKIQDTDKYEESEKNISEQPCESQKNIKYDQNLQQDPIKWFGILVPQSLKQAQSSFNQVIELSADIASLQTAIVNSRHELWSEMEKLQIQETNS